MFVFSLLFVLTLSRHFAHCQVDEPKCRDLDYCNYRGKCDADLLVCECEPGFTGVSCANVPPILLGQVEVPGGLQSLESKYYTIEQSQYARGQRIYLRTNRGQADIFASIGIVPVRDLPARIQFVAKETEEKNVVMVVADTEVPATPSPLDLNLYVTVTGVLDGEQTDYDIWTKPPIQPEGPIPKIQPWAGSLAIALCVLMCVGVPAFVAFAYWRQNLARATKSKTRSRSGTASGGTSSGKKKKKRRGSKSSGGGSSSGSVELNQMDTTGSTMLMKGGGGGAMAGGYTGGMDQTGGYYGGTVAGGSVGGTVYGGGSEAGYSHGTDSTYLSPYANNWGNGGAAEMAATNQYMGGGDGTVSGSAYGYAGNTGGGGSVAGYPGYPSSAEGYAGQGYGEGYAGYQQQMNEPMAPLF